MHKRVRGPSCMSNSADAIGDVVGGGRKKNEAKFIAAVSGYYTRASTQRHVVDAAVRLCATAACRARTENPTT